MNYDVMHLLSSETLNKILQCDYECETLDFKLRIDLSSRHEQLELARDILAMTNTLGGFIVIGVEDKTFRLVGVPEHQAEQFEDGASVNSKMEKIFRGHVVVHAAVHQVSTSDGTAVLVALLFIPPRQKMLPAPIEGNYTPEVGGKEKRVFSEGDIFIRKADSTTKAKTEEDYTRRHYSEDMDFLQFMNPCQNPLAFSNPYNIAVIARDHMFKGREEESGKILRWVSEGNHVTVYGLQRIGKTSLVEEVLSDQARQPKLLNKIRFAVIELQNLGSDYIKQKQFLQKIIEAYTSALSGTTNARAVQDAFDSYLADSDYKLGDKMGMFSRFRRVLEVLAAHSDQNVVLFLDEFSELCRSIERNDQLTRKPTYNIEKTHPHEMYVDIPFMKQFSSLLKSTVLHRKLTFVLAVRPFVAEYDTSRDMQVLKLTKPVRLFYLNEDAAKSLITDPIHGVLDIDAATVDYLYRQTAGHPYLIQFIMQELVDAATFKGRKAIRMNDVKAVEQEMISDGAPYAAQFDILDADYSVEEVMDREARDLGRGTLALISKIGTTKPEGWVEEQDIKRELAKLGVLEQASSTILAKLKAAKIIHEGGINKSSFRVSVPLLRKRYVAQNMFQQYFPERRK